MLWQSSVLKSETYPPVKLYHPALMLQYNKYPMHLRTVHLESFALLQQAVPASSLQNRRRGQGSFLFLLSLLFQLRGRYVPPAIKIRWYAGTDVYAFPSALRWPIG